MFLLALPVPPAVVCPQRRSVPAVPAQGRHPERDGRVDAGRVTRPGLHSDAQGPSVGVRAVTVAIAMLTPIIRETSLLDALPDPLEAYFRPLPGLTTFTLFPWAGFLTGGCVVGAWLDAIADPAKPDPTSQRYTPEPLALGDGRSRGSRRLLARRCFRRSTQVRASGRLRPLSFSCGWAFLSWRSLPRIALSRVWRGLWLQEFGRASLFVYWIHVELVYGVLSAAHPPAPPVRVALLPLPCSPLAMFGLVRLKDGCSERGRSTQSLRARGRPQVGLVCKSCRFAQFHINRLPLARYG